MYQVLKACWQQFTASVSTSNKLPNNSLAIFFLGPGTNPVFFFLFSTSPSICAMLCAVCLPPDPDDDPDTWWCKDSSCAWCCSKRANRYLREEYKFFIKTYLKGKVFYTSSCLVILHYKTHKCASLHINMFLPIDHQSAYLRSSLAFCTLSSTLITSSQIAAFICWGENL